MQNYVCRAMLAAAVIAALLSCGESKKAEPEAVLRRAIGGEPSTLDPAAAADTYSGDVIRDLYEGLTQETPQGDPAPGVASFWTIDPTGTEYTFHLRPDARWSNGKMVRARDFIAAWKRALDPAHGFAGAELLRIIVGATSIIDGKAPESALGVSAPNDELLVVKLVQPAPYLPQLLSNPAAFPIYSDAAASTHDPRTWVSNGPYVLTGWSPGATVDLSRNPDYWDRSHVAIARVHYQVVPDDGAQYRQYRAGEVDMTDTVPAQAVAALRAEHSPDLLIAPFLGTVYYALNLSAQPLASVKLRRALAMAIDRKRVTATLGFGQREAFGFVPPGTWNYTYQPWDWNSYPDGQRTEQAKQLYREAGYTPASPLHLRVLYNSNPGIQNVAVAVASMWKEVLGVESDLTNEEYRVFLESRHDRSRWEVARLSWSADFNDASNFLDTFRSRSANNDTGYQNVSYDRVLDEAVATGDPDKRKQLLQQGERLMLADYPVIPLYHFVTKRLVKPYIRGVELNPLNHLVSKSLSIDSEH